MKKVLIVVVALVAIYFILAFIGPAGYKIERSVKIGADASIIYENTSVYANWKVWSPWAKLDPNAKYEVGEDEMSWDGNPENVGKGKMVTTKKEENKEFLYDLIFMEPWQMTSHGGFTYEQDGDSVLLTWFDSGEFGFFSRPMMLFMDLEAQIGPQFEQGLNDIKTICEAAAPAAAAIEVTEEEVEGMAVLYVAVTSSTSPDSIGKYIGASYGEIMALMGVAQLEMAGKPMCVNTKYDPENDVAEYKPTVAVLELPEDFEVSGNVQKGESYTGKVLKTTHVGPYANLHETYTAFVKYLMDNGYEMNGDSWEVYVDDPTEVSEEELRTVLYYPVK